MTLNERGRNFAATGKSERIDVRTTPVVKAFLQRAAAASHKNVTEFLLEAGINAAEEALADRRFFRLDDEQWKAFNDALDRPVVAKPRLARLLLEKSALELRQTTSNFPPSKS